jgi:hypothetical protein
VGEGEEQIEATELKEKKVKNGDEEEEGGMCLAI